MPLARQLVSLEHVRFVIRDFLGVRVIVVNVDQEYDPLTVRIVFAVFRKNPMILWIRILHNVDEGHECLLPY